MTAPWAALALLWGSLCAGKNEARRGGRRKGARSGFGRRAVFTNKGRARGLLAAPPAPSLHLPGRGQGARRAPRSLVLGEGMILPVRRPAELLFAEATPGSGFWLYGRVEPRESEMKIGAWGRWPRGAGRSYTEVAGL